MKRLELLLLISLATGACAEATEEHGGAEDAGVEDHIELVQRMIATGDRGDFSRMEDFWAPDIVVHFGDATLGFSEALDLLESAQGAFPDMRHEIEDLFGVGDKVVLRGTVSGTHREEFQGIPATNRDISIGQIVIYRFEESRIAEYWEQADFFAMMAQLGALGDA